MHKSELEKYFETNEKRILQEYFDLLRFKSISTDPAYHQDCLDCAVWLQRALEQLTFKTELIETPGKPVLLAERSGKPDAPRIVFYGHYDVQPADPLDLWESPPFEPEIRNGRVYARGALDNKGQTFYFLKAVEALVAADALDASLTIILEGEEESGSGGIITIMDTLRSRISGDVLLVCDTDCFRPGLPTIVMGLRGLVKLEVRLDGPKRDLHSGLNGGVCKNPAQELARVIATLHDENGRIAVEGYYEGIREPNAEEQSFLDQLGFSAEEYERENGVPPTGGEHELHPLVRIGFQPTIEVNGMYAGYTGAGAKTIIPSSATVKLTSRLAGKQNPVDCLARLKAHIQKHAPAGMQLHFIDHGVGGPAFSVDLDSPYVSQARTLLRSLFETEPMLLWEGGSIPVVSALAESTAGEALVVGFGLASDNIHAPNESFAISRFKEGFLYVATALQALKRA
jgi:acetylornithine deacetylase/succinyl-diaminopimelate desuccinylase-like protein